MPELAGYKEKGKEIFKKGWHPEKEGTTLKGQVKGLLGRGEDPRERYANHQSTPISSLRDPASFPPPPKRRTGELTPPPPLSQPTSTNPAESQQYGQQQQYGHQQQQHEGVEDDGPPARPRPYRVDTTGLSTAHLPPPPGRKDGADGRPPPPPRPSTISAGGLPSAGGPPSLPPRLPPRSSTTSPGSPQGQTGDGFLNPDTVRRLGAAGVNVPGFGIGSQKSPAATTTTSNETPLLPPPPYTPINRSARPTTTNSTGDGSGSFTDQAKSQFSNLSNRFSKLTTGGSSSSTTPTPAPASQPYSQPYESLPSTSSTTPTPPSNRPILPPPPPAPRTISPTTTGQQEGTAGPTEGTTWAQKQQALKTASAFHKDPRSVSYSDAKSAGGTIKNFRQRHGDQIAAGMKTAQSLGGKAASAVGGLRDRFGGSSSGSTEGSRPPPLPPVGSRTRAESAVSYGQHGHSDSVGSATETTGAVAPGSPSAAVAAAAAKKKPPPPPPPKKKPALMAPPVQAQADAAAPPPVPLATRPTF